MSNVPGSRTVVIPWGSSSDGKYGLRGLLAGVPFDWNTVTKGQLLDGAAQIVDISYDGGNNIILTLTSSQWPKSWPS